MRGAVRSAGLLALCLLLLGAAAPGVQAGGGGGGGTTTRHPTKTPAKAPDTTHVPTVKVTKATKHPTKHPTTKRPTKKATTKPKKTSAPTVKVTTKPTTKVPTTKAPTVKVTTKPTSAPTTAKPTKAKHPRTKKPTSAPTSATTVKVTTKPTSAPTTATDAPTTAAPAVVGTGSGTGTGSGSHTGSTTAPTKAPTTTAPTTTAPTTAPTHSKKPTALPTANPTHTPTHSPTQKPSTPPTTHSPTKPSETFKPTSLPTAAPSTAPTAPSAAPTKPTAKPTRAPTRFASVHSVPTCENVTAKCPVDHQTLSPGEKEWFRFEVDCLPDHRFFQIYTVLPDQSNGLTDSMVELFEEAQPCFNAGGPEGTHHTLPEGCLAVGQNDDASVKISTDTEIANFTWAALTGSHRAQTDTSSNSLIYFQCPKPNTKSWYWARVTAGGGGSGRGEYFFGVTRHDLPADQISCTDKKKGKGETGADCGGRCNPCRHFFVLEFNTSSSYADPVPAEQAQDFSFALSNAISEEIGIAPEYVDLKNWQFIPNKDPKLSGKFWVSAFTAAPQIQLDAADFVLQFTADATDDDTNDQSEKLYYADQKFNISVVSAQVGQFCPKVGKDAQGKQRMYHAGKSLVCENDGVCPPPDDDSYSCKCPPGFTTPTCGARVKPPMAAAVEKDETTLVVVIVIFFCVVVGLMGWLIVHTRRERRKYNQSVFEMLQAPVHAPESGLSSSLYNDSGMDDGVSGDTSIYSPKYDPSGTW